MEQKHVTNISQGKQQITTRKIPATNNEEVVPTSSVVQLVLFREMQSTNYNILVRTGTGMQNWAHFEKF